MAGSPYFTKAIWHPNTGFIQTGDGGFVSAGQGNGFHGGAHDMWVIKVNSSGTKLWACAMGGSDDDQAIGLIATSDGGFMASGYTYSYDIDPTLGSGYRDAWLVKLGSAGTQVWQRPYGPGGSSNALSEWLINTADGGIVSGGSSGYVAWLFEIK